MRIGGQQWSHHVSRRSWVLFAESIGLPPATILKRVQQTAERLLKALPETNDDDRTAGIAAETIHLLHTHLRDRAHKVLENLLDEA